MSQAKRPSTQNSKSDSRHSLPPTLFLAQPKQPPHFEPYSQNYRTRPYSLGQNIKANPYFSQVPVNSQNINEGDSNTQMSSGLLETVTNKVTGFLTGMKNAMSSYFKPKDDVPVEILHPSQQEDTLEIKRIKEAKPDTSRIQKIDFTPLGTALNTSLKENKALSETQTKPIPHKFSQSQVGFLNNSMNTDLINGSNMGNISLAQDHKNILNLSSNSGNSRIEGSTIIRKKEKKFSLIKKLNYCLDLYEDNSRTYTASQQGGFSKNLKSVLTEEAKVPVARKMYNPLLEFRWNRAMERFDAIHNNRKRKGDMEVESLNNSQSRGILGDTSLELEKSGFSQIRLKRNKINSQAEKESPMATNRIVVEMLGFPTRSSITIQNKNTSSLRTLPYYEETNEDQQLSAIRKKKTPAKSPIFEEDKCNRSTDTDSESVQYNAKFVSDTACQTSPLRSTPKIQSMKVESSPKILSRQNTERRLVQNIIPEKKEESRMSSSQVTQKSGSNSDIQIKIEEGTQNNSQNPTAIINENSRPITDKTQEKTEINAENSPKPQIPKQNTSLFTSNTNSTNQGILHNTPKVTVHEKNQEPTSSNLFKNLLPPKTENIQGKEENKGEKKEDKKDEKTSAESLKESEKKTEIPVKENKNNLVFVFDDYKVNKPVSSDASNPFMNRKPSSAPNPQPSNPIVPITEQKPEITQVSIPDPAAGQKLSRFEEFIKNRENNTNVAPNNPSSTQGTTNSNVQPNNPSNPTLNLFNKSGTNTSTNLHSQNLFAHLKPSNPPNNPISNPSNNPISNPIINPQPVVLNNNPVSGGMEIIDSGSNNGAIKNENSSNLDMSKSIEMGDNKTLQNQATNLFQNSGTNNLFNANIKPLNFQMNNNNSFGMNNNNNTNLNSGPSNPFQNVILNRANSGNNPPSNFNPANSNIFTPSNPNTSQNLFNNKPNNGNMFPSNNLNMNTNNNNGGGMGGGIINEGNMGGGMGNQPANPFLNKKNEGNMDSHNTSFGSKPTETAINFLGMNNNTNNNTNSNGNTNDNGRVIRKILPPMGNKDRQRAF